MSHHHITSAQTKQSKEIENWISKHKLQDSLYQNNFTFTNLVPLTFCGLQSSDFNSFHLNTLLTGPIYLKLICSSALRRNLKYD